MVIKDGKRKNMCERIYITANPFLLKLRHYSSIKLALQDSINLNKRDDTHPAFELYELRNDKTDLVKIGTLARRFGTDDFSFVDKYGEKIKDIE